MGVAAQIARTLRAADVALGGDFQMHAAYLVAAIQFAHGPLRRNLYGEFLAACRCALRGAGLVGSSRSVTPSFPNSSRSSLCRPSSTATMPSIMSFVCMMCASDTVTFDDSTPLTIMVTTEPPSSRFFRACLTAAYSA